MGQRAYCLIFWRKRVHGCVSCILEGLKDLECTHLCQVCQWMIGKVRRHIANADAVFCQRHSCQRCSVILRSPKDKWHCKSISSLSVEKAVSTALSKKATRL